MDFEWIQNEKGKVVRYISRLVTQGVSQRPNIDYAETYSPMVDRITFRYIINLPVHENLDMCLMDVVTTYFYGSLDNNIFTEVPKTYKVPETYKCLQETCSIKFQNFLYGLKQSTWIWYNHLSKYLLNERYKNNPICPCIFIRRSESKFSIIFVYVDDLNITDTHKVL